LLWCGSLVRWGARERKGGRLWVGGWVGVGRKEENSRVEGGEFGGGGRDDSTECRGGGGGWGVGGEIRTRGEKGTGAYLLTSSSKHENFFENYQCFFKTILTF